MALQEDEDNQIELRTRSSSKKHNRKHLQGQSLTSDSDMRKSLSKTRQSITSLAAGAEDVEALDPLTFS